VVRARNLSSQAKPAAINALRWWLFLCFQPFPPKGAAMTWKVHIFAIEQRRVFSRILQILESQMVSIHSLTGTIGSEEVCVTFLFSCEQEKAYRIEALLHRLEGIREISILLQSATP
jgi:hypothetical protein